MGYQVIAPLALVAPAAKSGDLSDANGGPRYFYEKAVIPDGFNDERCDELVKDGLLEKVKGDAPADTSGSENPDSVDAILAEVGDDKAKAQTALDAETAKDKPRKTLVSKLEAIVKAE